MKALPFPLVYDADDTRLYLNDSAESDVLPTVAWLDDNCEPETNDAQGQYIAKAANAYPALLAYVEQMARMTTPGDLLAEWALAHPGEELISDDDPVNFKIMNVESRQGAMVTDLIEEARKLLA
ncbi:MAG TPA: hypothetical protein VGA34_13430 [Alteraurantiacibacter sp.]